jgi:hypothetical protein
VSFGAVAIGCHVVMRHRRIDVLRTGGAAELRSAVVT